VKQSLPSQPPEGRYHLHPYARMPLTSQEQEIIRSIAHREAELLSDLRYLRKPPTGPRGTALDEPESDSPRAWPPGRSVTLVPGETKEEWLRSSTETGSYPPPPSAAGRSPTSPQCSSAAISTPFTMRSAPSARSPSRPTGRPPPAGLRGHEGRPGHRPARLGSPRASGNPRLLGFHPQQRRRNRLVPLGCRASAPRPPTTPRGLVFEPAMADGGLVISVRQRAVHDRDPRQVRSRRTRFQTKRFRRHGAGSRHHRRQRPGRPRQGPHPQHRPIQGGTATTSFPTRRSMGQRPLRDARNREQLGRGLDALATPPPPFPASPSAAVFTARPNRQRPKHRLSPCWPDGGGNLGPATPLRENRRRLVMATTFRRRACRPSTLGRPGRRPAHTSDGSSFQAWWSGAS